TGVVRATSECELHQTCRMYARSNLAKKIAPGSDVKNGAPHSATVQLSNPRLQRVAGMYRATNPCRFYVNRGANRLHSAGSCATDLSRYRGCHRRSRMRTANCGRRTLATSRRPAAHGGPGGL